MSFTRRPYTGSCHCGRLRYVVYIKTPTTTSPEHPEAADATEKPQQLPTGPAAYHEATGQTVYRCNCTTCTKLSFFHLRLADAPGDFYVLAPRGADGAAASPVEGGGAGWGAYHHGPRRFNTWVFCTACGARPFAFRGAWSVRGAGDEGVPEEARRAAAKLADEAPAGSAGEPVAVWSPRREGWEEGSGKPSYISVNLTSVDAKQEGFDLRDFGRFRWIQYYDLLNDNRQSADEPFEAGMF
jgi:hypothetical protein